MTEQNEAREVSRAEYVWLAFQDGCAWMTHKFASWFTTAWLYLILWGVVGIAFTVLLYIDGVFSRSLAPDSIEPLSFQAMGWAYRFFAAGFLMAAARCAIKGIPGKWTFRWLGAFASLIVCLHAFGFGFEALVDKRANAEIIEATQENIEADRLAIIEQLENQKQTINANLALAIEPLDREIRQYITDGLNNDDLADDTRARRNALQDDAKAKIDVIDAEILALLKPESRETALESAEMRAEAKHAEKWHPLFVGLAQAATASWDPTDDQIYIAAIIFIVLWVLLAESLVIFLPERIYRMHLRDAELAGKHADGDVKVTFTQDEWEYWEAAKAEKDRRNEAAQQGAKTRRMNGKRIEAAAYYDEVLAKMIERAKQGWTPQGIADSVFKRSLGEMIYMLDEQIRLGRISQEEYDLITGGYQVNGKDKFTDEGADDADDDTETAANA